MVQTSSSSSTPPRQLPPSAGGPAAAKGGPPHGLRGAASKSYSVVGTHTVSTQQETAAGAHSTDCLPLCKHMIAGQRLGAHRTA
jgi:hypothetical protein